MGNVTIDPDNTAVLFTDPQMISLKPTTVMWDKVRDLVEEDAVERLTDLREVADEVDSLDPAAIMWDKLGDIVEENDVVEKLANLQEAAQEGDVPVIYSPHYYGDDEYESWENLGTIDQLMFDVRMYDVDQEGSDFVPELQPDENTFVLAPHKHMSGFWANDIQAQLTKRGIDTIVLAGMFANLCVESHMRDAVENGYEVLVVPDATGAPGKEMHDAAKTNFQMIAHKTAEADEVTNRLLQASS